MSLTSNHSHLIFSLGGSLIKDLWADLQVNDNDDDEMNFSLEQLERELAHLDDVDYADVAPTVFSSPFSSGTAASIVVSQQAPAALPSTPASVDAWQKSLEQFTALSLERDFLAADSARKSTPKPAPPGFLADAEDYNVAEAIPAVPPGLVLPPGIRTPNKKLPPPTPRNSILATPPKPLTLEEDVPQIPPRSGAPKTPFNSVSVLTEDDDDEMPKVVMQPPVTIPEDVKQEAQEESSQSQLLQSQQPPPLPPTQQPPPPQQQQQQPPRTPNAWGPPSQGMPMHGMMMPPQGMMMPPQGIILGTPGHGMMSPQGMHAIPPQAMAMPQVMSPQGMPMGIPVPQMMKPGTPWQSPPPPPRQVPSQQYLYCTVHPDAPTIPATALESTMMTSRDLAYVLHAMLKPVLLMGASPSDYDIQLLQRRAGQQTPGKKANHVHIEKELKARSEKTIQFMKEKNTLGHITKTDVMRPRALLSVSAKKMADDSESHESRASLWKARVYIDQGQQAATALRQIWQSSPPGTVPKQVQHHLMKLFKVLGLSFKDDVYTMEPDKDSLAVILKLSKGKIFIARLLDQALLPPNAVQVLVPAILSHVLAPSHTNTTITGEPDADARLFNAVAHVLTRLPQWQPESLVKCLEAANSKQALMSQPRMECLHVLLRRGNAIQEEEFVPKWKEAEAELMKLLS